MMKHEIKINATVETMPAPITMHGTTAFIVAN